LARLEAVAANKVTALFGQLNEYGCSVVLERTDDVMTRARGANYVALEFAAFSTGEQVFGFIVSSNHQRGKEPGDRNTQTTALFRLLA